MSETKGVIFIEARIRDDKLNDADIDRISYEKVGVMFNKPSLMMHLWFLTRPKLQAELEHQLSSENLTFELLEEILDDSRMTNEMDGEYKLGPLYQFAKDTLDSLKVVEYMGPAREFTCYTTEDVRVEVQIYSLYNTSDSTAEEDQQLPQAEIISLPHSRFANLWEELVFQDDIKGDLIWVITNILKFSRLGEVGDMNPLILLHGPPGTGKTTLCRGLAQKASIRLNTIYTQTRFIQIKTATLLSKYYSESARQVDEIFTKITHICRQNPDEFICVLIDEVESIASSREFSSKSGESQDSLRATNALLTGLDRTKINSNIIFLFTSNMYEALDFAFLDRCGLIRSIDPPSIISQYEILRTKINKLMRRGVIEVTHPIEIIPTYDEATLASTAGHTYYPGCKLLNIVHMIRSGNVNARSGKEISGRSITQLPEQAILRYLRSEKCDLNMALAYIIKFIIFEQDQDKASIELEQDLGIKLNRERKRKFRLILDDICDSQAADKYRKAILSQSLSASFKIQIEECDM
ncbi:Pachytene checkpoint protein 2-like protein [Erysiphe neolycopersici]|uniref:Pachytene checkpoint protein 2-like protein n=1 Tax=Erysiphe neolycopersici TaxID=212602 RepID=A0A420HPE8_9PEZI|nr:Pachytene checkpoint protein 2-like protein [Erysiphe neolycopersici]